MRFSGSSELIQQRAHVGICAAEAPSLRRIWLVSGWRGSLFQLGEIVLEA